MKTFISWIMSIFGHLAEIWATFKKSDVGSTVIAILNDDDINRKAIALVRDLASTDLSSAEKHDRAVSELKDFAYSQGWITSTSIINTIIELAYQAYQLQQNMNK